MIKNYYYFLLLAILLNACQPSNAQPTAILPSELPKEFSPTLIKVTASATSARTTPVSTTKLTPIFGSTSTATLTPIPTLTPSIPPGDMYETVFTLPVGGESIIQYKEMAGTILGPNAIAILPDDSFLISELVGDHLLHFDQQGQLLNTIALNNLGIVYVTDMRVNGNDLFLLEMTIEGRKRIHHLSLDGALIASEEIPYDYPIEEGTPEVGEPLTLESSITGIAIDCDREVLLEIEGGSKIYLLSDILNNSNPFNIPNGYPCENKLYQVMNSMKEPPKITVGNVIYETKLTMGLGGLSILNVLADGSIYLVRDDVVQFQEIVVDQTVHYIGTDGAVQGAARVPLSEFYYPVLRDTAIGPNGDVFALLPRPDSLDVVRLNFYGELEPLIPGAKAPIITTISP